MVHRAYNLTDVAGPARELLIGRTGIPAGQNRILQKADESAAQSLVARGIVSIDGLPMWYIKARSKPGLPPVTDTAGAPFVVEAPVPEMTTVGPGTNEAPPLNLELVDGEVEGLSRKRRRRG